MKVGKFLRQKYFPIFFQKDINEPKVNKSAKSEVFCMHFQWVDINYESASEGKR